MPQYVFAVDLGGTKCSAAVVNRRGRVVAKRTVPVDVRSSSAPVLQIVQLAKDLAGGSPKSSFVAAGIAVPGLVRPNGTIWAPNLRGWRAMPLRARLRIALGIPVIVESDRNAAVIGECWRGAAREKSDVVVLMIGTGIGAGVLSGGRIIRGAHELSGCAGWLAISGQKSNAGSLIGELESLAAGPAIARAAQKALGEGFKSSLSRLDHANITAHDVATARGGDRLARKIFEDCGRFLGLGVANLVSLLDPEVIVIGGGLASAADLFLDPLKKAMMERAQPLAARQVKITVSTLRDISNLLGCARLAWDAGRK